MSILQGPNPGLLLLHGPADEVKGLAGDITVLFLLGLPSAG